ncbi:hypothetical protein DEJ48_10670 [Streptomyces venezuelae]|uniref:Uncharacterized protein n=1 Tax=Streptomyces venezuelae TaxID=54571 RepID=A0A5P2BVP8_STRVZ|nr:hypothetical protein [Streptomyces venezuelae]QES33788.1 hypothetical protein DEJ48_10670 [Streptomyces venezuelae]
MLAFRLARGAHPVVQLRRLLVAAASAGTGFLLLCTLAYAMERPGAGAGLRLAWCVAPIAATVYFAVAVARTDPGTRPRSGLSAVGLGPGRLMMLAAVSTAVACTLGSMLALLFFLHLRGDVSGLPFDGSAADLLAADQPLPVAAALTLLALVPIAASAASAFVLRPRATKTTARAGGITRGAKAGPATATASRPGTEAETESEPPARAEPGTEPAAPTPPPSGLPWGVALLAAGLAVETYTSRSGTAPNTGFPLPGSADGSPAGVLAGWALTALGLVLAGPGLTYLCGRLLQAVRPGALRLLAGRVLQEEARRIGRPLGVLCAVASGAYASIVLYAGPRPEAGPLTTLGALLVAGCAVLTLATASVEARQARSDTTSALLRLGAPATMLRGSAALRAGALFAVFGPLTWVVAQLAALPLTR